MSLLRTNQRTVLKGDGTKTQFDLSGFSNIASDGSIDFGESYTPGAVSILVSNSDKSGATLKNLVDEENSEIGSINLQGSVMYIPATAWTFSRVVLQLGSAPADGYEFYLNTRG